MGLYLLKMPEDANAFVRVYARDSEHIIELVDYYRQRARDSGHLEDPKLGWWVKKIPSLEDIEQVRSGHINYHVGMIVLNPDEVDREGDFFSERMQVADDFTVAVSLEAMAYFDLQRRQLPNSKRRELYKFQIEGGAFSSLNFIPEDVVQGITSYDIFPHLEKSRDVIESIRQAKAGHPNLA